MVLVLLLDNCVRSCGAKDGKKTEAQSAQTQASSTQSSSEAAAAAESSFEQGLSQMSLEDGMVETEKLRIIFLPQNATEAGHIQIIVSFN